MPRKRKTEDMSIPTILNWLKIYHTELVKKTQNGEIFEEPGKRSVKGLRYTIKALEDSYSQYKRESQAARRKAQADEYEKSLRLEV